MVGQVTHETGTVKVRVDPYLKIDGGTLGFQSDDIIKEGTVTHHGTENHLIITSHHPSDTARHPGLHKNRNSFVVPTG